VAVWIDSHAHLDDAQFDADREATLARARAAGVGPIVTVGTDEAGSRAAVALAAGHDDLWAAVGCHPHEADRVDPDAAGGWLAALGADPKVVAVGETGLDFYKKFASVENQRRLFETHLSAARALAKPVVIHCRDAHAEVRAILARAAPPRRGVIHCFSGSADDARAYLELGFVLSIAGPVTYPSAGALREAIRGLPPGRLLVETDCPYLAPQERRGRRNEPANAALTGAFVAGLLGLAPEAFAETSSAAAREVFGIR
jgi:TatD DNase family protein